MQWNEMEWNQLCHVVFLHFQHPHSLCVWPCLKEVFTKPEPSLRVLMASQCADRTVETGERKGATYYNADLIFDGLKDYFDDPKFCDVQVIASDGRVIHCIKVLLCASSPVFAAMFYSDMQEGKTNQIKIPDVESDLLYTLLEYMHHGTMDMTHANVLPMHALADKYDVSYLVDNCQDYERELLIPKVDNCCELLQDAFKHKIDFVVNWTLSFLLNNHEEVCETTGFKELSYEVMCALKAHATRSEEHCTNNYLQLSLLTTITKWIESSSASRKEHILPLFGDLDFSSFKSTHLASISAMSCIEQSQELRNKVWDAMSEIGRTAVHAKHRPNWIAMATPMQTIRIPSDGWYYIIARGARGKQNRLITKGAQVEGCIYLTEGHSLQICAGTNFAPVPQPRDLEPVRGGGSTVVLVGESTSRLLFAAGGGGRSDAAVRANMVYPSATGIGFCTGNSKFVGCGGGSFVDAAVTDVIRELCMTATASVKVWKGTTKPIE